jgi:hypothetical protein
MTILRYRVGDEEEALLPQESTGPFVFLGYGLFRYIAFS